LIFALEGFNAVESLDFLAPQEEVIMVKKKEWTIGTI
jgi:hypothetical protein